MQVYSLEIEKLKFQIAKLRRMQLGRSSARYDQQHAAARLVAIRQDIARRTPIRRDAFTMEIAGRTTAERKVAGAALLSKIRMAILERDGRDWVIGGIAGFDLTCSVSRNLSGGLFSGHLVLQRTDYEQVINVQDDLTALGLISRLEHVLERFEADVEEQTRRAADAAHDWQDTNRVSARCSRCKSSWMRSWRVWPSLKPTWRRQRVLSARAIRPVLVSQPSPRSAH